MQDFKAYIFDLDGTLLNTLDDLAASTNYALRAHGMAEHSVDDIRRFVGNGVRRLLEQAVEGGAANPRFDDVAATFRQHYMEHSIDNTAPYPGVIETLAELKRRGKRIAVVSNKFYAATQELCRHFFGDYVEVAIGEGRGIRRKPAPDMVYEALRQLGVAAELAVYVGDSDVDVATARAAALPCISVLWGFRDRQFLCEHGATLFVGEPCELLA